MSNQARIPGYQAGIESLANYDDVFSYVSPEEAEKQLQYALREQQSAFMDMFTAKLENPAQPLQYQPDYLR